MEIRKCELCIVFLKSRWRGLLENLDEYNFKMDSKDVMADQIQKGVDYLDSFNMSGLRGILDKLLELKGKSSHWERFEKKFELKFDLESKTVKRLLREFINTPGANTGFEEMEYRWEEIDGQV